MSYYVNLYINYAMSRVTRPPGNHIQLQPHEPVGLLTSTRSQVLTCAIKIIRTYCYYDCYYCHYYCPNYSINQMWC